MGVLSLKRARPRGIRLVEASCEWRVCKRACSGCALLLRACVFVANACLHHECTPWSCGLRVAHKFRAFVLRVYCRLFLDSFWAQERKALQDSGVLSPFVFSSAEPVFPSASTMGSRRDNGGLRKRAAQRLGVVPPTLRFREKPSARRDVACSGQRKRRREAV